GVPAELKAPADIAAAGRKCSGNACGDVGECVAYVGNILLDFDFSIMSQVLRVPNPQFRELLKQAMQGNMTTLKDWVKYSVNYPEVASQLINGFARQWGELDTRIPDQELIAKAGELHQRSVSGGWLRMPGRRYYHRKIKIAEGLMLMERRIGSDSSAAVLVRDGKVEEINIFGNQEVENKLHLDIIGQEWNEDLWAGI
ncbi:MAG: hypothetical protein NTV45_05165, partial [Firmicutes bacterium]|nr:hypothetical protein [Bacillota bacterium]